MARKRSRSAWGRAVAVIVAGVVLGGVTLTPAGADFKDSIRHIRRHMKRTFYTKTFINSNFFTAAESEGRFLNVCVEPVQLFAHAYIDDTLVDGANFTTNGVIEPVSCFGPIQVRSLAMGTYEVAFPPFLTDPGFPDDLAIAQVTAVGANDRASYQFVNVASVGVVLKVYRYDGASNLLEDGDFTFALTNWMFDAFITPTKAAARKAAMERAASRANI